ARLARRLDRGRILTLLGDQRDHLAHLHAVRAFGNGDPGDGAFVDRLELHRRLVGLDLGEDVAGLHRVALLDQPLGQRALLHGGRQRRHLQFDRHLNRTPPARRYTVPPDRVRAWTRRSPPPRSLAG